MRTALTYFPLLLLLLITTTLTGCMAEAPAPEPRTPLYQSSSGKRVIINGDGAELADLKVRVRRNRLKVYDAAFQPLGFVRSEGSGADFEVELISLDRTRIVQFQWKEDDEFTLGDRLRLERIENGWAFFSGDNDLLGLLDRGADGGWRLRTSYNDSKPWTATAQDGRIYLHRATHHPLRSAPHDLFAPVGLLALAIETLDPLEAMALATLLSHHLGDD